MKDRILIVEDDKDIREALCVLLSREGYEVIPAKNGHVALEKMYLLPDLVVLDIMMPGISGIETCKRIRANYNVPILFLTAKSSTADKTEGLLAGGDDYLSKPFSGQEFLARVNALLRRFQVYRGKQEDHERYLIAGELNVNDHFNEVFKGDKKIELTEIEYRILKLFMQHRNKIFTVKNIYESVWKEPYFYCSNNTVMVHISKLRNKIEDEPQNPDYILTEWGRGYRFAK